MGRLDVDAASSAADIVDAVVGVAAVDTDDIVVAFDKGEVKRDAPFAGAEVFGSSFIKHIHYMQIVIHSL